MTVSPALDWSGLSHEMRLSVSSCPDRGRIVSRSPVSWMGVPVGRGSGRPAAPAGTGGIGRTPRWRSGASPRGNDRGPSGGFSDRFEAVTRICPVWVRGAMGVPPGGDGVLPTGESAGSATAGSAAFPPAAEGFPGPLDGGLRPGEVLGGPGGSGLADRLEPGGFGSGTAGEAGQSSSVIGHGPEEPLSARAGAQLRRRFGHVRVEPGDPLRRCPREIAGWNSLVGGLAAGGAAEPGTALASDDGPAPRALEPDSAGWGELALGPEPGTAVALSFGWGERHGEGRRIASRHATRGGGTRPVTLRPASAAPADHLQIGQGGALRIGDPRRGCRRSASTGQGGDPSVGFSERFEPVTGMWCCSVRGAGGCPRDRHRWPAAAAAGLPPGRPAGDHRRAGRAHHVVPAPAGCGFQPSPAPGERPLPSGGPVCGHPPADRAGLHGVHQPWPAAPDLRCGAPPEPEIPTSDQED